MAYTTPATWVAAAIVTAAQLNQEVRDNITDLNTRVGSGFAQYIPLSVATDITKSDSAYSTVTGLSFACVSGKSYNINLVLSYECAGTSTGLSVAFDHPGGTARAYVEIHGVASAAGHTDEHLTTSDTSTGTSGVNSSGTIYLIDWIGRYTCSANGTFSIRYARNGVSTNVTIHAGSGGLVIATA